MWAPEPQLQIHQISEISYALRELPGIKLNVETTINVPYL